ncbi:MerR family transcriptional regulator [Saccharopolyspora montiporae]|uniref:MerR family transcriptional regulator n=1 Tax=Saccharopolyspora montiporae TaxID=2781240 RepID=UPI00351C2B93
MWKVGEIAERAGLTVRALHHWDRIGLVRPSARTGSGHRLYGDADVRRLYEVVALRDLGLSLDAIADVLGSREQDPGKQDPGKQGSTEQGSTEPAAAHGNRMLAGVLSRHLAHVDAQIAAQRRLRDRLAALLGGLRTAAPLPSDLLELVEEVTRMNEKINAYYTAEQLATLQTRRERLGEEAIAAVEAEWPQLIAQVQAEMDAGTDPTEPRVRALAARWMELLEQFDGGDPEIREANRRIVVDNPAEVQQQGGPPEKMIEYITRAAQGS